MNKPAIIAFLCFMPLTAHAELYDESTITRETPYRMECPYNEDKGYHDCGNSAAPNYGDYLPTVVPEQDARTPPLLPTLLNAVKAACRKVGKNTEYCLDEGRFGAEDIHAEVWK